MKLPLAPIIAIAVGLLAVAPAARAASGAWDPQKVTALARDLEVATRQLYDSFEKLPPLEKGSRHTRAYFRLKQEARHMKRESRWLARALEQGHDQEQALPGYESVVAAMRGARQDASEVKTNADFQTKADRASAILDSLAPFFSGAVSDAPAPQ